MNSESFASILGSYDYTLPPELIAKEPASPRDSARLLIYNRNDQSVVIDQFSNIIDYLPKNAVLVFNRTKVIPARFDLKKKTGGNVEALMIKIGNHAGSIEPEKGDAHSSITVLATGSFKPGDRLTWEDGHTFTVLKRVEKEAILEPSFPIENLHNLLEKFGKTPLPPYMKDSPLSEDRRRNEYQTVFAKEKGSVAAPTAGLHFTKELIKNIAQSGRGIAEVTLHVNLGTFAPLTEEQWRLKKLHTEYYSIDPDTIALLNRAKVDRKPIIAIGTTSVRTLESASDGSTIVRPSGSTDLFMTEETRPHFVDHLITNFHVPRSSLLMLVSAFTGREKLLKLYDQAIKEQMRFFSFGDGMMIV